MKHLITTSALCLALICGGSIANTLSDIDLSKIETHAGDEPGSRAPAYSRQNLAGSYLASQFAQRHQDWDRASRYLNDVLIQNPQDPQILKRAMILSVGAGDMNSALQLATRVQKLEPDNALAILFLTAGAFHDKNYAQAAAWITTMPDGGLSEFMIPLLQSWSAAALGKFETDSLNKNSLHIQHAIMIADYLGRHDAIEDMLEKALKKDDLTAENHAHIADIYNHIGKPDKARPLYEALLKDDPADGAIAAKLENLKSGRPFHLIETVTSPEQGMAVALYDMAQLLYQEYSDDSARVFAHVALYLDPTMTDNQLLLAAIAARNENHDAAIEIYQKISPRHPAYLEAQRRAAKLYLDKGDDARGLQMLEALYKSKGDIESLIDIGDAHRMKENFTEALAIYNRAAAALGDAIPARFWDLHYVRGMCYEQLGQWDKAEADLKQALVYQPDHPYVLNYLGYSWADKGMHLEQALDMIERAVAGRPEDGYIRDSLGWVHYKMGNYVQAIPPLEKAVALLPYDPVINDHLGDAYWKVGRKAEARFQWARARNFAKEKDAALIAAIDDKMTNGLQTADPKAVLEAQTRSGVNETLPSATKAETIAH